MVNPKHSVATLLIVTAIVVCALGILILPQVDLPDFVLNGAKVPKITVVHGRDTGSSCSISKFHCISSPTFESRKPPGSHSVAESHHPLFVPHALLSLRC
jgi:hypothetical protein